MSSMQIREATMTDAASISVLIEELGYQLPAADIEAGIAAYGERSSIVLVAEDSGEIVGFVSFHAIPLFHARDQLGRITAMSISSKRQREGIGRALLERLDDIARDRGCSRIEVTSGDRRAGDAHLFYEACGYQLDCRRFQKMLGS